MTLSRSPLKRKAPLGQRGPILKSTPALRERKCSNCGTPFKQQRIGQQVCSAPCASSFARRLREQKERKETRERKQALKTRSDWLRETQAVFNAYIRARDEGNACICCGRTSTKEYLTGSAWDCGHYRSTGSAPHLRFHEDNAHRQLVICNRHGAGRAVDYRIGLIARIGLARVEALEADNTPRHYTIDDLKQIKAAYKAKLKALKAAPPAVTYSETDDFTDAPEPELASVYEGDEP
jgi:hypothetical protein